MAGVLAAAFGASQAYGDAADMGEDEPQGKRREAKSF
jgi:hypothetical protein